MGVPLCVKPQNAFIDPGNQVGIIGGVASAGKFFEQKYKVKDEVELTNHEGWKKYIIGSFNNYAEAKAFGQKTRELVKDAFIVAYDNGERIPVNQALTNKKINQ